MYDSWGELQLPHLDKNYRDLDVNHHIWGGIVTICTFGLGWLLGYMWFFERAMSDRVDAIYKQIKNKPLPKPLDLGKEINPRWDGYYKWVLGNFSITLNADQNEWYVSVSDSNSRRDNSCVLSSFKGDFIYAGRYNRVLKLLKEYANV